MVTALLETWPVPDGHVGHVAEAVTSEAYVAVSHLVAAGLLPPGTELVPRSADLPSAVVTEQGLLQVNGHQFESPSGAVRALAGHAGLVLLAAR